MGERQERYYNWLMELTAIPTASGREGRVISYVKQWVKRRKTLEALSDAYGNLTIAQKRTSDADQSNADDAAPIYLQAHLDHPAFVVDQVVDRKTVLAEFRGGVSREYFVDAPVLLYASKQAADAKPLKGIVRGFEDMRRRSDPTIEDSVKILRIEFKRNLKNYGVQPKDIIVWDTGKPTVERRRLYAPACDDLSAVAAALCAYDQWLSGRKRQKKQQDVRILLTRAEEVGFIGTIAACKAQTVPTNARIICLENSKSFADSPIGAGPVVRVGDRTSTFDPDLTFRCARIAMNIKGQDPSFLWQRKLMPGGTCEASAFQAFGYTATCLCLPLGNYHNMNETTGKIDSEIISLDDFDGLVRLLAEIIKSVDDPTVSPSLRTRLDDLFSRGKDVLNEV